MGIIPALVAAASFGTATWIFIVKEPKTNEDKMVGGFLLTGGTLLLLWPIIRDKLVWG